MQVNKFVTPKKYIDSCILLFAFVLLFPVLTHADIQHEKLWEHDHSYVHFRDVPSSEKLSKFSDDGSLVVTTQEPRIGAGYSIVKIWDVKTLKCIATFKIAYLLSLAISPDNKTMAVIKGEYFQPHYPDTGHPYSVEIYNIASGALEKILVEPTHGALSFVGIAFSPDSKLLVTGSGDSRIRIWNLKSGKVMKELLQGGWTRWLGFTHHQIRLVALGGRYMSYANIKLWSLHPTKILKAVDEETIADRKIEISSFTMAPNGKWFATNNYSGEVQIFSSITLKLQQHLAKDESNDSTSPRKVVFSPDSKLIAFVRNGHITIRKVSDINEIVQTFPILPDDSYRSFYRVLALGFSKSGKRLQWTIDKREADQSKVGRGVSIWKADIKIKQ